MKKLVSIFMIGLLCFGCSSEDESTTNPVQSNQFNEDQKLISIETLFDKDEFDDLDKVALLKELKICSDKNKGQMDYMHPSCTPRFFELFPCSDKLPLKDAFVLLTKSKTYGFPLRRVAIFVREKGQLVKVNEYVANIIGIQRTGGDYNDLIFRFNDKDQGQDVFYNCIFKWEKSNYKYASVEVIEGANWGGPVKAELKDSISKEVYKDIFKNGMIVQ